MSVTDAEMVKECGEWCGHAVGFPDCLVWWLGAVLLVIVDCLVGGCWWVWWWFENWIVDASKQMFVECLFVV